MIIQPSNLTINQANQPDLRAHAATSVKSVTASQPQAAPQPVSAEALDNAVAVINQAMQDSNQALRFSVDTDTHRTVVKMVDTSTGELIRQFPSDATLAISRGIAEFQQGLLLKQKA
jgi:flagellar protein FlaG